jgi:hypothetical protein
MSDDFAQKLYPGGGNSSPMGPSNMAGWSTPEPVPTAPPAAPTAPDTPPQGGDTLASVLYGKRAEPAQTAPATAPAAAQPAAGPPQAEQLDHAALVNEYESVTQELGLGREESGRLMQLHERAVEAHYQQHTQTVNDWRKQTEAAFTPAQISDVKFRLDRAIGNDKDAAEFRRLLGWSGIGNNPSAVRVISRLLGRR